jgi:hypothetical protein
MPFRFRRRLSKILSTVATLLTTGDYSGVHLGWLVKMPLT